MANYKDLPTEIYCAIFRCLSKQSQYQCMFVCKSWHTTAAQIYFSDFLLPLHRPKKVSGLLNSPHFAICVRTLKIYGVQNYQRPFGGQELHQLIENMPHLNRLFFDTYDTQAHLETLSQIPLHQLRNIKEIHIGHHGTSNEVERLYIWNNMRLCDNIEYLRLQHLRVQFEANRLNLTQCLVQFKGLKHLVLMNSIKNGGIVDLDLASVASVCPYLEKLEFRSYFPALKTRQAQPNRLKYLKTLTLGALDVYNYYLTELTTCITFSTLHSLTLELYEASLKHWVDDGVFEAMKVFAKCISSLKNVKISIVTLPERMTLASLVLREATVSLWEVMNILRNDRPLFGCVVIDLDNVRFNRLNPYIQVIDNQVIKLRTCLSYPNIANSNNSFTWDPFFCANSLNHGLPFINSLCVDFTLFYSKSLRRMVQLLECLLSRCHWLRYLYIGSNVSSMLFCPAADALLDRPSNAEYKLKYIDTNTPVTTKTKENLKCASFESIQISSYLLQAVSILLNIHTLKVSRCYYDRDASGAIVLSLQEILYIPRLELTLDFWDKARQIFPLLIKIQMAQDYTLYYQCGPQQEIIIPFSSQHVIDNVFDYYYNAVIHVKCQRVDVVSLYSAMDDNFAVLQPWSDYLSSISREEFVR